MTFSLAKNVKDTFDLHLCPGGPASVRAPADRLAILNIPPPPPPRQHVCRNRLQARAAYPGEAQHSYHEAGAFVIREIPQECTTGCSEIGCSPLQP